jgi:hypothetical protein
MINKLTAVFLTAFIFSCSLGQKEWDMEKNKYGIWMNDRNNEMLILIPDQYNAGQYILEFIPTVFKGTYDYKSAILTKKSAGLFQSDEYQVEIRKSKLLLAKKEGKSTQEAVIYPGVDAQMINEVIARLTRKKEAELDKKGDGDYKKSALSAQIDQLTSYRNYLGIPRKKK